MLQQILFACRKLTHYCYFNCYLMIYWEFDFHGNTRYFKFQSHIWFSKVLRHSNYNNRMISIVHFFLGHTVEKKGQIVPFLHMCGMALSSWVTCVILLINDSTVWKGCFLSKQNRLGQSVRKEIRDITKSVLTRGITRRSWSIRNQQSRVVASTAQDTISFYRYISSWSGNSVLCIAKIPENR